MTLKTRDIHPQIDGLTHSEYLSQRSTGMPALDLVMDVAARYEISALSGLLASTRNSLGQDEITVAVLGRFNAGKSSFLNHFIGRSIFPVGVVPITAVVTEVRYGVREEARV